MQTNFTPDQLKDPHIEEADAILRRCVHCGLCTAVCSTYVLLGDERDSPRGRIYLIKDMLETGSNASKEVTHHVDRCLTCLSCMTTCPGGVDYMHLVDIARAHIEETGERPLKDRLMRQLLAAVVPYPKRFRLALIGAAIGRPFGGLLRALGLKEMAAMLDLAPRGRRQRAQHRLPGTIEAATVRRKRVIMLAGCAQQVLRPDINDATIRLLVRNGVEIVVPHEAGCCGALVHHMGREEDGRAAARRNIDAWFGALRDGPIDAILINASGCGTTVKDYGHMLARDPVYAERASQVSALTRDISEFLVELELGPPKRWSSLRVAYHSACSMQHGQQLSTPPRALLKKAGFAVAEVPEGHICCGSAGTYNILQPELSAELRTRKTENIMLTRPDLVATGNIGCITQLQSALDVPIVHTVELLDWAYGGPTPKGLEKFQGRVKEVPEGQEPRIAVTGR